MVSMKSIQIENSHTCDLDGEDSSTNEDETLAQEP